MGKALEQVTIERPCTASWEAMRGDDRVRHCLECHLDVYDLSAMTETEAEALISEREGRLCVRVTRRADGTVLTQDCEGLRGPPRPCGMPAVAPSLAAPMAMAAKPEPPPGGGPPPTVPAPQTPTTPRPVPIMMGAVPPPPPVPVRKEDALGRDAALAEITRAVRAHADPDRAEALTRSVETEMIVRDPDGAAAGCPRCKGSLWLPSAKKPLSAAPPLPTKEQSAATKALLDEVTPFVKAAFDESRAAALLRELTRRVFGTGRADARGACPHCRAFIGMPQPIPVPAPVPPPK